MAYIGQVPVPQSTERRVEITATSGQTSFSVGTYAVGFADFLLNGIRLQNSDVTATDGTTVTLASGAAAGDVLTMVARTQTTDGSAGFASTSEVQGTHTTGSITLGTTALTVASATGISTGDYVVGEGITPGTIVSAGGGTTSLTLSANAGATLSSDPVSFYKADKVLSPGLVAGGLCRAWICFGMVSGTPTTRGAHNIRSISDEGAGNYDLNLTTAMPDENGCIVCSTLRNAETVFVAAGRWISPSVVTLRVNNSSNNILYANSYLDLSENIFCAIFR
jgi:hypothetical protein